MSNDIQIQEGTIRGAVIPAGEGTCLVVDSRDVLCGRLVYDPDTRVWVAYHVSDAPAGKSDPDRRRLALAMIAYSDEVWLGFAVYGLRQ